MIYKFNNIELDIKNYRLIVDGVEQAIEPQVFNLIVYLVKNKAQVLSRDEILNNVWKGKNVSDSTVSNHIKSARKVLGDDGRKQEVIKTIHSRGYQFVAKCETVNKTSTIGITQHSKSVKLIKSLLLFSLFIFLIAGLWLAYRIFGSSASVEKTNNSIAVLAFKDFSPNSDQAYFSEGMSEELLNLFTQIPDLRVASRTSSFSFKDKDVTLKQIGKELNVNYVIEGSVRKSGEKLRITVQLIRVVDSLHLWSKTYDYQTLDIFNIQDEIAQAVSKQLKLSIAKDMQKDKPINPLAHSLYLKALYYFRENTDSSLNNALDIIKKAIDIDSTDASTWILKSRIHYKLALYSYDVDDSGNLNLAKQAVIYAKQLNNDNATTNAQMALINLLDFNFDSARFNIELAMNSESQDTSTVDIIAYYLLLTGQIEKCVDLLFDDIELTPINDTHYLHFAAAYLFYNQLKDTKKELKKYRFFHPTGEGIYGLYFYMLVVQGEFQKAIQESGLNSNYFWKLSTHEFVEFAQGHIEEADKLLAELIEGYSYVPVHIAIHYAFRKDSDNAFKWLEIAYKNHDLELLYLINHHAFRALWDDLRWNEFLLKIELPESHWLYDLIVEE